MLSKPRPMGPSTLVGAMWGGLHRRVWGGPKRSPGGCLLRSRGTLKDLWMPDSLQRLFNVRPEERLPVLLAVLFFFCVLTALMVLRPAR